MTFSNAMLVDKIYQTYSTITYSDQTDVNSNISRYIDRPDIVLAQNRFLYAILFIFEFKFNIIYIAMMRYF